MARICLWAALMAPAHGGEHVALAIRAQQGNAGTAVAGTLASSRSVGHILTFELSQTNVSGTAGTPADANTGENINPTLRTQGDESSSVAGTMTDSSVVCDI